MVKIIQKLVSKNKYNIKCPNIVEMEGITVHNTANDASAENEIAYMTRNDYETSFHFAVDDIQAVQGLPLNRNGWHASDGNGPGNMSTIAIEICYSKSGGERFTKAENNAAELIAQLLKERGWGIDKVKRHYDYAPNKKYCPHRTMDLGWERFLNMISSAMGNNSSKITSNNQVNVYYRVKTLKHGWLPEVKNLEDYAGYEDSPIIGLAIRTDKGSVKYRVHLKNKGWLGYVTGYNINDIINGYAGNGKDVIDLVEVYYFTPNDIRPYKKAKYKINNYPWQYDNEKTNGQDGYAGVKGVNATKFQIVVE